MVTGRSWEWGRRQEWVYWITIMQILITFTNMIKSLSTNEISLQLVQPIPRLQVWYGMEW